MLALTIKERERERKRERGRDLFEEHPKLKLQKEFTEYVSDECFKVFQKYALECAHASTAEKIAIRTSDPPGVSILPSLFTAKLNNQDRVHHCCTTVRHVIFITSDSRIRE